MSASEYKCYTVSNQICVDLHRRHWYNIPHLYRCTNDLQLINWHQQTYTLQKRQLKVVKRATIQELMTLPECDVLFFFFADEVASDE